MIGDDIVNDVGGAQQCGMKALQVRTGKYRSVDVKYALCPIQILMAKRERNTGCDILCLFFPTPFSSMTLQNGYTAHAINE
ncbi:hypothetical protein JD844_006693 [Phrynosoma platyrhinos]|uniref:Phospholysine phosphohistidine inorganic pyrophosphate phosphatase n=1 Tax=Phrynosoma platyrhinos TaxID=52577 RepID=A0ABQ7T221_PHRPL|nr:hypothetical protein JD844_006693 [Phrynosoma platyrhinos]